MKRRVREVWKKSATETEKLLMVCRRAAGKRDLQMWEQFGWCWVERKGGRAVGQSGFLWVLWEDAGADWRGWLRRSAEGLQIQATCCSTPLWMLLNAGCWISRISQEKAV